MNDVTLPPPPPLTAEQCQMALLSETLKNSGLLGIPVPGVLNPPLMQAALRRCLTEGWLRLIDVEMLATQAGPIPSRVFQITKEGRVRLMELRVTAN